MIYDTNHDKIFSFGDYGDDEQSNDYESSEKYNVNLFFARIIYKLYLLNLVIL